jgi:hypothetical protein
MSLGGFLSLLILVSLTMLGAAYIQWDYDPDWVEGLFYVFTYQGLLGELLNLLGGRLSDTAPWLRSVGTVVVITVGVFTLNSFLLGHLLGYAFAPICGVITGKGSWRDFGRFIVRCAGVALLGYIMTVKEVFSIGIATLGGAMIAWRLKSRAFFAGAALGATIGARLAIAMIWYADGPTSPYRILVSHMKDTIAGAILGAVIVGTTCRLIERFIQRRIAPAYQRWLRVRQEERGLNRQ